MIAAMGWIVAAIWVVTALLWMRQAFRWKKIALQEQALAHRYAETLQRSIRLTDDVLAFNDAILTKPAQEQTIELPYSGPVQ